MMAETLDMTRTQTGLPLDLTATVKTTGGHENRPTAATATVILTMMNVMKDLDHDKVCRTYSSKV